jgi:hypothetical protein
MDIGRARLELATAVIIVAMAAIPVPAFAGIHTWDVNEVFSNQDGTIQFVELWEANNTPGETGVGNGTITSDTQTFDFIGGAVEGPTSNKYYLAATQAFADLPGAPTPDEIIPPGSIPFFDVNGDTVAFGGFDSWMFGAVPTNGTDSLDRFTGVGPNTPTNYNGDSATVDASPPQLPATSPLGLWIMAALLGTAGLFVVLRRQTV